MAAKKKSAPAQLFVWNPSSYNLQVYRNVKEAFEAGNNIVHVYKLEGKKQLTVKVEDIK